MLLLFTNSAVSSQVWQSFQAVVENIISPKISNIFIALNLLQDQSIFAVTL